MSDRMENWGLALEKECNRLRAERDKLKLALGPLIASASSAAILTEDPTITRVLQHDIDHAKEAMSDD